ncbi:histone H2B type 3-A-like [Platysternon megacephalum]|uniref:Histone H2B type 3-A-like n=1 Tax=Platysternon megacephalum TaxID=55544 RepID=A0A4D9DPI2_9SAUR|nr:histone H2B type 3-A-like [Platysternon megacephalum]
MCEQAARYCRESVHKILHKQQPQIRGLDGLLRWIVTKMSDKSILSDRELLQEGQAAAGQGCFPAGPRKGTSVILDIFRRADKNGKSVYSYIFILLFF